MADRGADTLRSRTLCRLPTGVQPIGGGHGQHANIAPPFAEHSRSGDSLCGNGALIRHDQLGIRPRLLEPGGAVHNFANEVRVLPSARLLDLTRGETKIDRTSGFNTQPSPLVRISLAVALHVVESPA